MKMFLTASENCNGKLIKVINKGKSLKKYVFQNLVMLILFVCNYSPKFKSKTVRFFSSLIHVILFEVFSKENFSL